MTRARHTVIATIITTTHGCGRLDSNTKEPQKRRETRMAGCHLKCWIVRKTRICFVASVQQTLLQEKSSDPESWGTEYWSTHFQILPIRTGSSRLLLASPCISLPLLQPSVPKATPPTHTHSQVRNGERGVTQLFPTRVCTHTHTHTGGLTPYCLPKASMICWNPAWENQALSVTRKGRCVKVIFAANRKIYFFQLHFCHTTTTVLPTGASSSFSHNHADDRAQAAISAAEVECCSISFTTTGSEWPCRAHSPS